MAVSKPALPILHPVAGVRLATVSAGIKTPGRPDLVLFALEADARCAAVFTRNAFCAAPVTVAREHLAQAAPRALLINTGNANAGTGQQGIADARACCTALAQAGDWRPEEVLPFSTGVIGEPLPTDRILSALPALHEGLEADGWAQAASGILTTDTVPKGSSRQIDIDGHVVTITGIAKGSGMIRPDMATMLAFVATDAAIAPELLQRTLTSAVNRSFNRISVDGDTSTNDACVLAATGRSSLPAIEDTGPRYEALVQAVTEVCEDMAQAIVRDGEGATKLIRIEVLEAEDEAEANAVAYTVAHSPLVKTAFFASDANWGRILAAVGRAGIDSLDIDAVTIHLDEVCIVREGGRAADYEEAAGQAVMARDEITVRIALARGTAGTCIWTCDLSFDYVRINAEYRT